MNYSIKSITIENELNDALELCYKILGEHLRNIDIYKYEAWLERLNDGRQPMMFASINGKIIAAILGRAENEDSLVIGFVACEEEYRNFGIAKAIMQQFEEEAKKLDFKYITLGSEADGFYEKCGYHCINEIHGQKIYQKLLNK